MCAIMNTTCPIYVSAIDKKTGKAFVKKVDVPYRRTLKIESYLNYYPNRRKTPSFSYGDIRRGLLMVQRQ